jgi:hypothetical protein
MIPMTDSTVAKWNRFMRMVATGSIALLYPALCVMADWNVNNGRSVAEETHMWHPLALIACAGALLVARALLWLAVSAYVEEK